MIRLLAAVSVVALGGCVTIAPVPVDKLAAISKAHDAAKAAQAPVPERSFRTNEPQTVRERVVASVAAHCGEPNAEGAAVRSAWRRTEHHEGLTRTYERCVVTHTPEPADDSAELRVAFELADCPRITPTEGGLKRAELSEADIAAKCSRRDRVPAPWAATLASRAQAIEEDVFRR
jgi:hypothetical protein